MVIDILLLLLAVASQNAPEAISKAYALYTAELANLQFVRTRL